MISSRMSAPPSVLGNAPTVPVLELHFAAYVVLTTALGASSPISGVGVLIGAVLVTELSMIEPIPVEPRKRRTDVTVAFAVLPVVVPLPAYLIKFAAEVGVIDADNAVVT